MNVAYATPYDSRDIRRWSGTSYHIAQSLEHAGATLHRLGPLRVVNNRSIRAKQILHRKLLRRGFVGEVDERLLEGYAHQMQEKLARLPQAQVVLAPHQPDLSHLKTRLPVAVWTDCTFASMVDFYPDFQNLPASNLRDGHDADRRGLERADLCIFACHWGAQSAVRDYQIDPAKVRVVPFGANITCHRTPEDIRRLVAARPAEECRLLFIGRIWGRKGGDFALAAVEELRSLGVPATLTLVGSLPEAKRAPLPDWVRPLGFISKRTPEGQRQFDDLLGSSHFLILPTRAEAYGIVFCEASSFGVPSLATNVGGISTVLRDGVNGRTFPLDAPPRAWAEHAAVLWRDRPAYERLAMSSFEEYQSRLNWDVAGKTVFEMLKKLTG